MSGIAIEFDRLSKSYRGKKGQTVQALREASLAIGAGEVFGFLGPNGAGKSTSIKILTGLIRPTAGTARIFGQPVDAREARRRIGYLPENPAFYDFLSAREYLGYVTRSFGLDRGAAKSAISRVLDLLELAAAADRPIRGYSKGMVQRLGLAQALVHDPDLYILDEPMSGLDPLGRALVKQIILDLKQAGKTVFFSTHVTADIERVCDRVGVIVKGVFREERIVSELLREGVEGYDCRVTGAPAALLAEYALQRASDGICELFVPRLRFDAFAAELLAAGGAFELVEPRRRDIEEYFLALVRQAENA